MLIALGTAMLSPYVGTLFNCDSLMCYGQKHLLCLMPSMMYAIVFAYIWTITQSLAVVTVYPAAFDETRDAIAALIGYGLLVGIWQMLTLILLDGLLLWKGNWSHSGASLISFCGNHEKFLTSRLVGILFIVSSTFFNTLSLRS